MLLFRERRFYALVRLKFKRNPFVRSLQCDMEFEIIAMDLLHE